LISEINRLVKKAGKIAMDYFGKVEINYKDDNSVVTEADLRVEEFLFAELSRLIPGSDFLGEEGIAGDVTHKSEYLWIVDPIDGSSCYSKGLPVWGISVALVKNLKPFMASVYFPKVDSMFWADDTGQSFFNGARMANLKGGKRIKPQSFVCIPSNLFRDCGICLSIKSRSFGSSCYHILQVARDAAFACVLCSFYIWDLAASQTIAHNTGAEMYDSAGHQLSLWEMIESEKLPEPLIVTYPDRLAQIMEKISYNK